MLNSEEINPIALAVIELHLSESISQIVSQKNLLNRKFYKFHNLMQRFRVDLKAFLGSTMPNQCCHAVTKLMFVSGIFRQENPNLCDTYI